MNTIACAGADLQAGTADDCCPQGFACSTSGTTLGCIADGDGSKTCASYVERTSCENDSSLRAKNDPMWTYLNCEQNIAGTNVLCKCNWSLQNNCVLEREFRTDNNPEGSVSTCSFSSSSSACANGYQTVTITATGHDDPSCVSSVQTLPCGKPVIELPFFSGINVIIAIIVIVIIYLLLRQNIHKKGERHRHVFK
jgi:hypothetical protein